MQAQQRGQRFQRERRIGYPIDCRVSRWIGCRIDSGRRGRLGRAVKRQFGGWPVRRMATLGTAALGTGKTAHRLQPPDFQRAQTFAQRRFQRVFPAALDVQAAPQPRQIGQTVFFQPRLELAVSFHLVLQRFQGFQPGG